MKTYLLIFLLVLSACKTQEDIQREQMVDNLAVQIVEGQKLSADYTVKISDLQERINDLQGRLEEKGYQKNQLHEQENKEIKERISIIEEQIKLFREKQESFTKEFETIKKTQKEQNDYLQKLLQSLKKKGSRPKTLSATYKNGLSEYRKANYDSAKNIFLKLIDNKKIQGKTRAHVLHNLGMIAYIDKDYKSSKTYFSKLYTEFPKSSYNKNGLLFFGQII